MYSRFTRACEALHSVCGKLLCFYFPGVACFVHEIFLLVCCFCRLGGKTAWCMLAAVICDFVAWIVLEFADLFVQLKVVFELRL